MSGNKKRESRNVGRRYWPARMGLWSLNVD